MRRNILIDYHKPLVLPALDTPLLLSNRGLLTVLPFFLFPLLVVLNW